MLSNLDVNMHVHLCVGGRGKSVMETLQWFHRLPSNIFQNTGDAWTIYFNWQAGSEKAVLTCLFPQFTFAAIGSEMELQRYENNI